MGSLVSTVLVVSEKDGPLQNYIFCSDMKFKMAATAGLSLTLDPMGKMFQNTSSLKPLGQKNAKFVEDHPMNIHVQFGFNHICSF
jgi:hypothetical protein